VPNARPLGDERWWSPWRSEKAATLASGRLFVARVGELVMHRQSANPVHLSSKSSRSRYSCVTGDARHCLEFVAVIVKSLFVVVGFVLFNTVAQADTDTLQPVTFASIRADLKKSLAKMSIRDDVVPAGCLDGGKDKRTVCNFKIGSVLGMMVESKKGEKEIVAITMICSGTQGPTDVAKCLLGYTALMAATAPELTQDARTKVLSTLTSGLEVGNEISIQTDERKFLLQKSMGLWFHVIAADGEGD
jgi:hypothetical protein